jgi:hypothetical protein
MMAGKANQAISSYNQALAFAAQANIKQNLMLSQFHQGLGECLKAKGDIAHSETELAMAKSLANIARDHCETNNALLSFAIIRTIPVRCN